MLTKLAQDYDLVIHHNDLDGYLAAWVAWKRQHDPPELWPTGYKQPPPDVVGKRVLIVDYCYPTDVMCDLMRDAALLHLVDHHKTTLLQVSEHSDWMHVQMGKSACLLMWELDHHASFRPPPLIEYANDQDLRLHKLVDGPAYCLALELYTSIESGGWSMVNLDILAERDPHPLVLQGQALLGMQKRQVTAAARQAYKTTLAVIGEHAEIQKIPVIALNYSAYPFTVANEVAATLLEQHDDVFASVVWCYNGTQYYYSLRSRKASHAKHIDVSAIALSFGGGGHPSAAGFLRDTPLAFG